jgi:hypothetical protein
MLSVRSKCLIWLVALAGPVIACAGTADHPAVELVDRATTEMRTDPEASKRDADQALKLLEKDPDSDLEVNARLILCDYYAERDTGAAEREIDAGTALLPKAQRKGLKAGLLDCRGQMFETAGNNAKARAL